MTNVSMETRPRQDISGSPKKGSNWLFRASFIFGILAIASVPIFFFVALNDVLEELSPEIPIYILLVGVAVGIVAIATGIGGLIWSRTHAALHQPKGLAIGGIVLGAVSIVVNIVAATFLFAFAATFIFMPH